LYDDTDINGCAASYCQNDSVYRSNSNSSVIQINVINSASGINQRASIDNQINIYPNPNNGNFVIDPNNVTKQLLQIYDINGMLVLSQTINGKTSIDIGNLPEGVYNLNLARNEGVVNKRLVIAR
jgi:hypothetical protein